MNYDLSKIRIKCAEIKGARWYLHASGYSWLSFSKLDDHPQWSPIEKPSDLSKIVIGESVSRYEESADAALQLVEWMAKPENGGWTVRMDNFADDWDVKFTNKEADIYAHSKSLPLALCLAFLKANGINPEKL